jgi:hypothetical protein
LRIAYCDTAHLPLQVFFNLLMVLLQRHSNALLPTWQAALDTAGDQAKLLQQQVAGLSTTGTTGDARLKAYVNLLLGLINASTQVRVFYEGVGDQLLCSSGGCNGSGAWGSAPECFLHVV